MHSKFASASYDGSIESVTSGEISFKNKSSSLTILFQFRLCSFTIVVMKPVTCYSYRTVAMQGNFNSKLSNMWTLERAGSLPLKHSGDARPNRVSAPSNDLD